MAPDTNGAPPELDGIPITADTADVVELLLTLTAGTDYVTRARLRVEWGTVASDLRRKRRGSAASAERRQAAEQERGRRRDRGGLSSHVLKNCLSTLEKLGAVRRIGEAPRDAVVVLDRARLQAAIDLWD